LEAKATDISLEVLRPAKTSPDSAATRREKMVRDLADAMLNQRFSKLAKARGRALHLRVNPTATST
jgi:zinc protease